MRQLFIALIRRVKHDPTWMLAPTITLSAVFVLVMGTSVKALRGWLRRPWLGRARGLLLIGRHVTLRNPRYVRFGRRCIIEDYAEIQGLAQHGITLGDRVTVGRFAMIRPSGYYSGRVGEGLRVGHDSTIGPFCYIGCSGFISIGNHVMIAPRVSFFAENHNFADLDVPMQVQGVTLQPITIQDNCWIGSQAMILAGVTVGEGSIIAGGSIVTHDVPPFTIVAGNPARVLRGRTASDSPTESDANTVTAKRAAP